MGFGRAKRAKKALSFYRMSFGLDPPYRVLCDTSFIAQAAAKNIDIRHYLNKLLQERNWPVVTECVLAEIARAGPTLLAASLAAAKFSVIPCPDHAELARQRAAELQAQAHVHDDDDASTHEEQDDDDDDDDNDDETSAAVADDDEDDDDDDDDDEDTDQHESTHDHEHDDSATLEPLGTEPENAGENLRVSSLRCIWDLLGAWRVDTTGWLVRWLMMLFARSRADKGEMVCVASMSKRLQQLVRERARFPLLFISHGTLILDKPNPNAVAIAREVRHDSTTHPADHHYHDDAALTVASHAARSSQARAWHHAAE